MTHMPISFVLRVMQGWLFMDTGFWTPDRAKALLTAIPRVGNSGLKELIYNVFIFSKPNVSV